MNPTSQNAPLKKGGFLSSGLKLWVLISRSYLGRIRRVCPVTTVPNVPPLLLPRCSFGTPLLLLRRHVVVQAHLSLSSTPPSLPVSLHLSLSLAPPPSLYLSLSPFASRQPHSLRIDLSKCTTRFFRFTSVMPDHLQVSQCSRINLVGVHEFRKKWCMWVCLSVCVCMFVNARHVCAYVEDWVSMCVCTYPWRTQTYIHTHAHTHIDIRMSTLEWQSVHHVYKPDSNSSGKASRTYSTHTWIHMCVRVCIHTYIHT